MRCREGYYSFVFYQSFEEVVRFFFQIFVLLRYPVDLFQNCRLIFLGVDCINNQKAAVGNFIKIVQKQIVEAISDIDKGSTSS